MLLPPSLASLLIPVDFNVAVHSAKSNMGPNSNLS